MSMILTVLFLLLFGGVYESLQYEDFVEHDGYSDCTNKFKGKTAMLNYLYYKNYVLYPKGTATRLDWLGDLSNLATDPKYLWSLKDCDDITNSVCIVANRDGWKGSKLGAITRAPDWLMTTRNNYNKNKFTFKIYCTSCSPEHNIYSDCRIKNMKREAYMYTKRSGMAFLKKLEDGYPSWFKWRIIVDSDPGRPTSYMKKNDINIIGKALDKFSLNSGISCWHKCRDTRNCDVAYYQNKQCRLYYPGGYTEEKIEIGAGKAYFRAEAPNGYTVRLGDCPGNDIFGYYRKSATLAECAQLCDSNWRCRGFMWYNRQECYVKDSSCPTTSLTNTMNVFYTKLDPGPHACPPGSVKGQNSICELCPAGEYRQGLDPKCKKCPSKSGGDFLGATSCIQPITIGLQKHSGFIFTARLNVGTPGNFLDAIIDTGSGMMVVNAYTKTKNYYQTIRKNKVSDNKRAQTYGSHQVSGKMYEDVVEVGQDIRLVGQQMLAVGKNDFFCKEFQAVVGLRLNKRLDKDMGLVQRLVEQDFLPENLFTVQYFPQQKLTFGRISEDFAHQLTYVPLSDNDFYGWDIPLDIVHINNEIVHNSMRSTFDTGASFITGPTDLMKKFLDEIPPTCENFPGGFPTFSFQFGGTDFNMAPSDYMDTEQCKSVFKIQEKVNMESLILGVPFMKCVYTVFHIEDKAIGIAKVPQQ